MSELDRVRWHCRRGLLELDLILGKFNRQHLAHLDSVQLAEFQELLLLPDNDLLDLVMGRAPVPQPRYASLVEMLRAA